ncbi:C40 family peptidase [Proteiniclasticum sp. SCR006]|uniref:C40 family peptidase n=1 Tax=Proteiniclasticum aestuarii TaxID=2817862 RepID=A0A939HAU2_9CLOT|nr:C40 family peptidase [Proteiniclasticum aestuarii]MBO1265744.1 C40 family peptidase [Proteiniclasticum aestuarii]
MKSIRKKMIAAVLATSLLYGAGIPVTATPLTEQQQMELDTVKSEYESILRKLAEIESEIAGIADEITDISIKIEDNNENIERLDGEIKVKNAEINETQVKLTEKETEYGERLRAMYKQGNTSIIDTILNSESIADFISRADAIVKLAKIDRELLDEIQEIKDLLDQQKAELSASRDAVAALKEENLKSLEEEKVKKAEAEVLLEEFEEEEKKILGNLAMAEMYFIGDNDAIINDSSSSDAAIQGAIASLRAVRENIVTDSTDAKVVDLIEKGKSILRQREAAREAARIAAERAEAERIAAAQRAEEERAAQESQNSAGSSGSNETTSTPAPAPAPKPTPAPAPSVSSASGQAVLDYAYRFLGTPYVWGGTTPSGFDCSGFTQYVYRHFGVNLPRVSRAQGTYGTKVSYSNLQAGDLVFFGSGGISHVGIYIGGGNMIHSPRPGKSVEISTMRYHNFITARRVLN